MTLEASTTAALVTRISFADALARTAHQKRHLLLGNGFSIGAHPAFGYPSLHTAATTRDPTLLDLFPPGDTNFEAALRACNRRPKDAARLREALVRAVAAVHPETSLSLPEEQCLSCRDFLEHFVGRHREPHGTVFTTNYDMLLHWVLSRQGKNAGTKQRSQLKCWDGFAADGEWNSFAQADAYYLHGAVHIYQVPEPHFPSRSYTRMLRYQFGRPLLKQVDEQLRSGNLPVFVAEGVSGAKKAAQNQRHYLAGVKWRFRRICGHEADALFTFGHSFGASDEHIVEEIGAGAIKQVYIGTFSNQDEQRANQLASTWSARRATEGKPPITVRCFDSRECQVWDRKRSREDSGKGFDGGK